MLANKNNRNTESPTLRNLLEYFSNDTYFCSVPSKKDSIINEERKHSVKLYKYYYVF